MAISTNWASTLLGVLVFGICACSGDDPIAPPETVSYKPGITFVGQHFELVIDGTSPDPPTNGLNTWTVSVRDRNTGASVDEASITLEPTMPHHGHGTSPTTYTASAISGAPAQYTLRDINLFMPGVWLFVATIEKAGTLDTVIFSFTTET